MLLVRTLLMALVLVLVLVIVLLLVLKWIPLPWTLVLWLMVHEPSRCAHAGVVHRGMRASWYCRRRHCTQGPMLPSPCRRVRQDCEKKRRNGLGGL